MEIVRTHMGDVPARALPQPVSSTPSGAITHR